MNGNILIPKNKVVFDPRDPMGGPFWDKFWKNNPPSRNEYFSKTRALKNNISEIMSEIPNNTPNNAPIYLEVKLHEKSTSKSSKPSIIFKSSNMDIISSDADHNLVVSGRKQDAQKLKEIIDSSNYDEAKVIEGNKKVTNLSREVFSLQSIRNRTTGVEGRVSEEIKKKMALKAIDIDCIIELDPMLRISDYDVYYKILLDKLTEEKVTKRNQNLFLGGSMSFIATLNSNEILLLLNNVENYFIYKVSAIPKIVAERLVPSVGLDSIELGELITDEIVGVFDSGIDNQLINGLVWNKENKLPTPFVSNNFHGTFVAARLLFGNNIFRDIRNKKLIPTCRVLDIQVLSETSNSSPLIPKTKNGYDSLMNSILEIVNRYHSKIKIYNFSISEDHRINRNDISEWTQFLDILSRKYDVLFVVCTGNHDFLGEYPGVFEDELNDVYIASPSDAVNALTVGSITQTFNKNSICKKSGWPSPFTRIGGVRENQLKPELVHYGGNIDMIDGKPNANENGVEGLIPGNYTKDSGTSFSTPLVTREAALAIDVIKKSNLKSILNLNSNYSNLTKAAVVHSSFYTKNNDFKNKKIELGYGLGIPDVEKFLEFDPNRSTIIYCDKISSDNKIQKLKFELPNEFSGKKVKFNCTFVYNPQVNNLHADEYMQTNLSATIRKFKYKETDEGTIVVAEAINPTNNSRNFKSKKYNVNKFTKKVEIKLPKIEVLIQMSNSQNLESSTREIIQQPYALIIDIIDMEDNGNINELMLKTNQFEIMVKQEIQQKVMTR